MTSTLLQHWIREGTRLCDRYQSEVVEAWDLCPWAAKVRRAGRTATRVSVQTTTSVAWSLSTMAELAVRDLDVAFLVYPRLALERREFDRFFTEVREADAARHALGCIPFALAAFHPDAEADLGDPARLVPFLRRTPDPTLQITRAALLDRTPHGTRFVDIDSLADVAATPPCVREAIAKENLATVKRVGVAEITRRFDDIRRDRDETYARLEALGNPEPIATPL